MKPLFDRSTSSIWPSIVASVLVGCSGGSNESPNRGSDDANNRVFASNFPIAFFAERIGGETIDIYRPIPEGVDPAFWRPTPDEIAAVQDCSLILLNGASYEQWLSTASLPQSAIVDTSTGFRDRYIKETDSVTHTHGPDGDHAHTGVAFTTWLDLSLAAEQADAVHAALAVRFPEHADAFRKRFTALEHQLLSLDGELKSVGEINPDIPLLASHPVYQYLARAYGLNIHSMHWEPDVSPTEEAWKELDDSLKARPTAWMLWEAAPLPDTTARLRQRGIQSVVFDPCGASPTSGDFLRAMAENIERLRKVFSSENRSSILSPNKK